MSVLPEAPASQAGPTDSQSREQPAPIRLEPRFTPATDSQLLVIETGLRLLAVWAVRAAESAARGADST